MIDDHDKYLDPEEGITCPYNPAHYLPRKRLGVHLQKCRKQHTELAKEFKDCLYNVTHKIPRPEYEYHLEICPDREGFYNAKYRVGEVDNDVIQLLNENVTKPLDIPSCEENWDDDVCVQHNIIEDIKRQANERVLLENYSNEPPAVLKAKREEARRKHREKMNADEKKAMEVKVASFPTSSGSRVKKSSVDTKGVASSISDVDDDALSSASYRTATTDQSQQTNISYETALSSTIDRLKEYQLVERKKKIGRGSGKIALNTDVQVGIGRGKLLGWLASGNRKAEVNLPPANHPENKRGRENNKSSGKKQ